MLFVPVFFIGPDQPVDQSDIKPPPLVTVSNRQYRQLFFTHQYPFKGASRNCDGRIIWLLQFEVKFMLALIGAGGTSALLY